MRKGLYSVCEQVTYNTARSDTTHTYVLTAEFPDMGGSRRAGAIVDRVRGVQVRGARLHA